MNEILIEQRLIAIENRLTKLERARAGDAWERPTGKTMAQAMVEIARAEIGTKEEGNNTGDRIKEYQAADWIDGTGYPWCASFLCWVVKQAQEAIERPLRHRPRTPGAWAWEKWARGEWGDNGDRVTLGKPPMISQAKAGDVIVFTFSHIGLIVEDYDGSGFLQTVEGNTNASGSREGDGVWEKKRKVSQCRSLIRIT